MPKLIGPLYSLDAAGPLAGAITFQPTAAGPVARAMPRLRLAFASPAPTAPQEAQRAAYAAAAAGWSALTPEQQDAYDLAADPRGWTGFNLWMSEQLLNPGPAPGTVWDSGATTWDAGATTWDNP